MLGLTWWDSCPWSLLHSWGSRCSGHAVLPEGSALLFEEASDPAMKVLQVSRSALNLVFILEREKHGHTQRSYICWFILTSAVLERSQAEARCQELGVCLPCG